MSALRREQNAQSIDEGLDRTHDDYKQRHRVDQEDGVVGGDGEQLFHGSLASLPVKIKVATPVIESMRGVATSIQPNGPI